MDWKGVLAAILLISVVAGVSHASSGVNLRVLLEKGKGNEKPNDQKVSPSPTPIPLPSTDAADKTKSKVTKDPPVSGSPSNSANPSGPGSKSQQGTKGGEDVGKGKDLKGSGSPVGPNNSPARSQQEEKCGSTSEICHDTEKLSACLQHPGNESKDLYLLVKNTGENALNVNIITIPPSIGIDANMLQLSKNTSQKIKVSKNATDSTKIVLNAGNGDCILQMKPSISDWNFFEQLPTYSTLMTPIYGAYFLFLTTVVAGGTWACCKFGRKRRKADAGAPYQQLEMGTQPQSSSVVNANTGDDWDQGWGDDWDEEVAVARPPDNHHTGSVSSNGLTSRSPKKDGWGDDWDD